MNIATWRLWALVVFFVVLQSAGAGMAQTTRTAHVKIPFEFWIGDSRLAAGDYQVEHIVSPTLVVFTRDGSKSVTEAYLIPVDDKPVKESESKLVFLVQNGKHYLYEVRGIYGRRVMTDQYGLPKPSGDNRVEVQMAYR